jgi:hypothetical protein
MCVLYVTTKNINSDVCHVSRLWIIIIIIYYKWVIIIIIISSSSNSRRRLLSQLYYCYGYYFHLIEDLCATYL